MEKKAFKLNRNRIWALLLAALLLFSASGYSGCVKEASPESGKETSASETEKESRKESEEEEKSGEDYWEGENEADDEGEPEHEGEEETDESETPPQVSYAGDEFDLFAGGDDGTYVDLLPEKEAVVEKTPDVTVTPAQESSYLTQTVGQLPQSVVEKAIVEVAMAYYHKNPYMQYDSGMLTVEEKTVGAIHRTTYQSPENTAEDKPHYSQCSEFCFDVYYEAMGYSFMGDRFGYGNHVYEAKYRPAIVAGYDVTASGKPLGLTNAKTALEYVRTKARPGDIVLSYGDSGSGHVMMIVGDVTGDGLNDAMHCWPIGGGNLDTASGKQKNEPNGSIVIQSVTDLLLTTGSSPNWCLSSSKGRARWYLFRPTLTAECKACHLTPATVSRMTYSGLSVSKTASAGRFSDVAEGETLTITESVTNYGTKAYTGLVLREYVPQGTTLVSNGGGSVSGNSVAWSLNISPGQTRTVSYSVRNNLSVGQYLTVPAGQLDYVPTGTFRVAVSGTRLSSSENAAVSAVAGAVPQALRSKGFLDLEFVNLFYRTVLGKEIGLPPTVQAALNQLFIKTRSGSGNVMLGPVYAGGTLSGMVLQDHLGGQYVTTGTDTSARLMEIREEYYKPGDVFISVSGGNTTAVTDASGVHFYIYLGGGKVLSHGTDGTSVKSFSQTAILCFRDSVFMVLRPTLGYGTLPVSGNEPDESGSEPDTSLDEESGTEPEPTEPPTQGGVLELTSKSKDETREMLAAYRNQNVIITCAYGDICNVYDCQEKTVYYKAKAAVGLKNMLEITSITPDDGWTAVITDGLVSSGTLDVKVKNLTINIQGYSFGMRAFTGEPVRITASSNGKLYFRGDTPTPDVVQSSVVDASGVHVIIGYSPKNYTAKLKITGALYYGTLDVPEGSGAEAVESGILEQR